jgi:hypothetical protein
MSKTARTFAAVATLALPSIATADVSNGSFETGYAGWSLAKESVSDTFATAALVEGGKSVEVGSSLLDHVGQATIANYSFGLPLMPAPTDGNWQALLLQNGPSTTRLSQVVDVPANGQLTFDLAYHNWDMSFSADQMLRVQLRDADTNVVLGSVFASSGALEIPMSHQTINVAAFSGMTVRLEFELIANNNFFDVQIDNIDLQTANSGGDGLATEGEIESASAQDEMDSASADEIGGGCSTGRGGASLFAALALIALRRRRR